MRHFLSALALVLMATLPAQAGPDGARAVAAQPVAYNVVETAVATHSQYSEPPSGCFAKIQAACPENAVCEMSTAHWVYVEYDFICQLKPTESISLYTYSGVQHISPCDTGERGDYTCGLHGVDAQGKPIDRPPGARLAGMDMRAIPDLVEIATTANGYRSSHAAAMLGEYAASPTLPDAKATILTYKTELLRAKAISISDVQKQGALISLLLGLGVELPVGDSQSILGDYISSLEPRHLTALETIANHADDPTIDASKMVSLYVRNFVDNPERVEPNRAVLVKAVSALGPRLQPSIGLLLERMRDSEKWPESLQKETTAIACAAFKPAAAAPMPQTLVIDNYGGARSVVCP